jgi:hypothetical protein
MQPTYEETAPAFRGLCASAGAAIRRGGPHLRQKPNMVDPKNYREVAIDLDAFKREVGPQFAHLNTMVNWILAVVVGAAASGGFAIYNTQ